MRAPVNSGLSFSLATVVPRRFASRVSCSAQVSTHTLSEHSLGRGLPGYLILFAPHAFTSQSQERPKQLLSLSVFLLISTDLTPPLRIPLSSIFLQIYSIKSSSQVELGDYTFNLQILLHVLYAQLFRVTLAPYVLPRLLAHS